MKTSWIGTGKSAEVGIANPALPQAVVWPRGESKSGESPPPNSDWMFLQVRLSLGYHHLLSLLTWRKIIFFHPSWMAARGLVVSVEVIMSFWQPRKVLKKKKNLRDASLFKWNNSFQL